MSIPRLAINKPVTTTMLMLGMALIGIGAMLILNVALFPDIDIPVAFVQAPYPGVDPAEMETIVTQKIEDEVSTVENIDKIESYSAEGFSQTVINFKFGTDISLAAVDIRAKVDLAKRNLPRDIEQVTVSRVDINAFPILNISIGGEYDLVELRRIADREIKPAFQRIPGVANVDVIGGLEREIRVKVHPDRLLAFNLTIEDVITAVSRDNQNTPLGNIEEGNFRYLLRSEGQAQTPEQLGDIIVKEIAGRPVYLAEMAVIEDSHKDIEAISRINGMPSVNIEIRKEANANPIMISDAAQKLIPELEELYRGKLQLVIGRDQTDFIRDTMQMVKDNATLGGLFAICVLFIFLKNYRSTIIIGIGIPIAILTTFGLLSQKQDITLNLMTLGGLALGIGMMIDNAIVVMENIYRFYTDNPEKDKKEMAAQATEEVLMPIFASTATTVAVFLPIGFVPAVVGEIFFNMSLSIIFSLLSSLTVAVTFIPMLCSRFLVLDSQYLEDIIGRMYLALIRWAKTHVIKTSIAVIAIILLPTIALTFGLKNQVIAQIMAKLPMAAAFSDSALAGLGLSLIIVGALFIVPLAIALVLKIFNLVTGKLLFPAFDFLIMGILRRAYVFVLNLLVSSAPLRIAYFIVVFVLFFLSFRFQPAMTFFPKMDRGEMTIDFETPEGTSVAQTDRITAQMEEILSKKPEIDKIITNSQVGRGTVSLALVPSSQREKTTTEVIDEAREEIGKIAGIRTINYREPQMGAPSRGKSIQIEVLGPDFDQIEKICTAIYERIKDLEGIKDLEDGIKTGRPEFRLVFDREKIRDLDLNLSKIAGMVRSHVFGSLAGKYRESNDEFDIRVEASDEARAAIARFRELDISLENGRFVKLSQIADFRPARGYSTIERKNQSRRLIVQADPDNRAIGAITQDISARIADIELPPGYQINFGGQNEEMVEAFIYLGLALIASILLVYMIMASQFESIVYPFIIMFTIPLSYMGVIIGLNTMGFDFSVTAMIGIIMLAGISVNNGIILIEYILQRRGAYNETTAEATREAGLLRFRPIMMTVFTTLLGMLPLSLGIGAGSDFYQPLAISVTGGLLVSTMLTLTFVPTVFIMVENGINLIKSIFGGFFVSKKPESTT